MLEQLAAFSLLAIYQASAVLPVGSKRARMISQTVRHRSQAPIDY
ncbi:hypothetical protein [Streptomyces sp. NPDC088864]